VAWRCHKLQVSTLERIYLDFLGFNLSKFQSHNFEEWKLCKTFKLVPRQLAKRSEEFHALISDFLSNIMRVYIIIIATLSALNTIRREGKKEDGDSREEFTPRSYLHIIMWCDKIICASMKIAMCTWSNMNKNWRMKRIAFGLDSNEVKTTFCRNSGFGLADCRITVCGLRKMYNLWLFFTDPSLLFFSLQHATSVSLTYSLARSFHRWKN
jgi:hypothetical protein